jgi:hypothetical protein
MPANEVSDPSLSNPEGVAALMSKANNEREWEDGCKQVKEAHGGNLPIFWYATVVISGLADKVQARWWHETRQRRLADYCRRLEEKKTST